MSSSQCNLKPQPRVTRRQGGWKFGDVDPHALNQMDANKRSRLESTPISARQNATRTTSHPQGAYYNTRQQAAANTTTERRKVPQDPNQHAVFEEDKVMYNL